MVDALPEVDVHEAARLASEGTVLLLDVREDDEWAAGRAPQARHAPLSGLHPDDVPTDRPVLALCRSGHRSGQATYALVGLGRDVRNVAGGMHAWQAAGLPVETDGGAPGSVL